LAIAEKKMGLTINASHISDYFVFHSSEKNSFWKENTSVCGSVNHSASHSRVAPENVGLQKEQKCNAFEFIPVMKCGCVLGIRKKEVGNAKR
jgi:hypothetical protein